MDGDMKTTGMDSTGKSIKVGDTVKFRGELYTIRSFGSKTAFGTHVIEFCEPQHIDEVADEFKVDRVTKRR